MKTPLQELLEFDPKQQLTPPTATPTQKAKNPRELITQWLLDKLQEESAEVIQAISKVRRFGDQNHHPDRKTTNHEELITELEDFLAIVAALEHIKYFDLTKHQTTILKKTQALIGN
jgi:NTP pyrophosphatase (non-canonical NTP hydrolase)